MGIDYNGLMLVGCHYNDLHDDVKEEIDGTYDGDVWEWANQKNLYLASEWFDCGTEGMIIGFKVENVYLADFDDWVINTKKLFDEAFKIFKVPPKLIGTQDIY